MFTSARVPDPETIDHTPVPADGAAPESVVVSAQMLKSGPAFGVIGFLETLMVRLSLSGAQVPFDIVHTNILMPGFKLLTSAFDADGSLKLPVPVAKLQLPVPIFGMLALSDTCVPQIEVSFPASGADGGNRLVTVSSSSVGGQFPVVTVHLNTLTPLPKPLTKVFGLLSSANVPLPLTTVHWPVPGKASIACKVTVSLEQTLRSEPAFAFTGTESR